MDTDDPAHKRREDTWLHLVLVNHVCCIDRRLKTRDSTFTTNNGRFLSYFRWPALPCWIMGCICPPRGQLCSEVNLGGVPEYPATGVFDAQELQPKAWLHLLPCPSLWMEQAGPVWLSATGNKTRFVSMSQCKDHFPSSRFFFFSYTCLSLLLSLDRWIEIDYLPR